MAGMNEEKLLILKMLEQGKITSEEAAKLIEAIEGGETKASANQTGASSGNYSGDRSGSNNNYSSYGNDNYAQFKDEVYRLKDKAKEWSKELNKEFRKFKTEVDKSEYQKDFNKMVDDFSNRAEDVGKTIAKGTVSMVDRLIDTVASFVDTNSFKTFGAFKTIDKTYESSAVIDQAGAIAKDLSVEAMNGHIVVRKHLEPIVRIRTHVKTNIVNIDEVIRFEDSEGKISLSVNKVGNLSVSHEVLLPETSFKSISFLNMNGKIYVEDAQSNTFECISKNSPIELMGVKSDNISVSTRNSRVLLNYTLGRKILVSTENSLIDIKHVKTSDINASTINGRVFVDNIQAFEASEDMNINLSTKNGGIKLNMNDMDKKGYSVKANTTAGTVNLLIPGLVYSRNSREGAANIVEAESKDLAKFPQKVYIIARTTNGTIEVVK